MWLDAALGDIPVHMVGGAALAMQEGGMTTAQVKRSPLTVVVALPSLVTGQQQAGEGQQAQRVTGMVYNDDGESIEVRSPCDLYQTVPDWLAGVLKAWELLPVMLPWPLLAALTSHVSGNAKARRGTAKAKESLTCQCLLPLDRLLLGMQLSGLQPNASTAISWARWHISTLHSFHCACLLLGRWATPPATSCPSTLPSTTTRSATRTEPKWSCASVGPARQVAQ